MLILTVGDIRQGKTALTTAFAVSCTKPVYANYVIKIPNYHELTFENIFQLPINVNVFIDEAYTWLESRRSNKETNIIMSHILYQSGKTGKNFYLNVQYADTIDLRFRNMCNTIIEAKKFEQFRLFKYDIYNRIDGQMTYIKSKIITFANMEKIFNLFDTHEIVKSDLTEKHQISNILNNSNLLIDFIQETTENILSMIPNNSYTHGNIELTLLEYFKRQKKENTLLWTKAFEKYIFMNIKQYKKK